jgi:2-C-methyl-D-erythritol 4-phosphate cytidylyltransferase / 2-C-methyl-D-erythritol 2,4-cyclodiphosphate synthase
LSAAALPGADAIVVAAGSSSRMGGLDKLAVEVAGRPLLAWSIDAIAAVDAVERIVVVASAARCDELRTAPWLHERVVEVVAGGPRRHESVAAGLDALDALDARAPGAVRAAAGPSAAAAAPPTAAPSPAAAAPPVPSGSPLAVEPPAAAPRSSDERVVLVHDGARPLVSPALVEAILAAAAETGAAIPVLPVAETVKRVAGSAVVETLDRSDLAIAQTPQGVRRGLLRAAFRRFPPDGDETWTDEAALLEACRIEVHAIPGEPGNLKVTVPADVARVAASLGPAPVTPATVRIGAGADSHPFGPGEPLALGGIVVAGAPRLAGHSDGDVALHAVADALLGGAGLGDLGRLFPAGPETPAGIASGEMLAEAVRRIGVAGFRAGSIDVTIVAARPRLGPHLDAMRAAIAAIAGIEPTAVSVKASTGNLAGMEGAGRGISAQAVATLVPALDSTLVPPR